MVGRLCTSRLVQCWSLVHLLIRKRSRETMLRVRVCVLGLVTLGSCLAIRARNVKVRLQWCVRSSAPITAISVWKCIIGLFVFLVSDFSSLSVLLQLFEQVCR